MVSRLCDRVLVVRRRQIKLGVQMLKFASLRQKPFEWAPGRPKNEAEFEELMWEVDRCLWAEGLEPEERPGAFPGRLSEAFRQGVLVYPNDALAELPGYEGDTLVAKGHRWYKDVYGDRRLTVYKLGFAPVRLGNALWRMRIPQAHGRCLYFADRNLANLGQNGDGKALQEDSLIVAAERTAAVNCLCLVEDLTQGMARRLGDEEIARFLAACRFAIVGLSWLVNLFWHVQYNDGGLFFIAFRDYAASTDGLFNGRREQSRQDSTQAAEKILKGLFHVATGKEHKGKDGKYTHNLMVIARSLQSFLATPIDGALLDEAYWPVDGKYGKKSTTTDECVRANHAVLKIAKQLSEDDRVQKLLEGVRKKGTP